MKWVLFFLVACLYASIGFGGGSGYLAILSFTELNHNHLRFIALACNILVVAYGSYQYIQSGYFKWKKVLPIVALSVPASFFGAQVMLNPSTFFFILGIALLAAGILMIWQLKNRNNNRSSLPKTGWMWQNTLIGGGIGFISGMVGIGGGIFLSPLLFLTKWAEARVIAATASFFILVNSCAGILGLVMNQQQVPSFKTLWPYLLAVLIGGIIGSRLSIKWLEPKWIKGFTAILVIFAAIRMLYKTSML
ncbi:MAG: putative membrane protein YfcA [Bacteroidia bacterium]|jgi:uncharacterized membrane protein YfcA